jgi:mercuric ion binding protein
MAPLHLSRIFDTMKKFAFALLTSFLFVACGEVAAPPKADTVITHRDLDSEVIKTVAKMSIEGMMCADGCGGKIQQELRAIPGVVTTELEFTANSPENMVKVEFDPTMVDENKLITCIHAIADGKYHVKTVEVLHYHGLQNTTATTGAAV